MEKLYTVSVFYCGQVVTHIASGNTYVTSWILCSSAISCCGSNIIPSKYSEIEKTRKEQYHPPTTSDVGFE